MRCPSLPEQSQQCIPRQLLGHGTKTENGAPLCVNKQRIFATNFDAPLPLAPPEKYRPTEGRQVNSALQVRQGPGTLD